MSSSIGFASRHSNPDRITDNKVVFQRNQTMEAP
jgi:hypothetical protein